MHLVTVTGGAYCGRVRHADKPPRLVNAIAQTTCLMCLARFGRKPRQKTRRSL